MGKFKIKFDLDKVLSELEISDYTNLGSGFNGYAILNHKDEGVYKITESKYEMGVVRKLFRDDFKTFPFIYEIGEVTTPDGDTVDYYVKDLYNEIDGDLGDLIDDNMYEIHDFFGEKNNMSAKKSNTNLEHYFDDKFLTFLSDLKVALGEMGLLPYDWDVDGFSLNVMLDDNGDYILNDF